MIIRKGTDSDLKEVISLLKVSLGEDRIPKTEALWNWKHRQNPFGESPILLAESAGKIIGVRAFLKWEYSREGKIISAQRAVDTAVHPDFQGKGIFSQLTRKLLEKSRLEGTDLIFNTPNQKSTPGYLKLGWEKWDRLPIKIKPVLVKADSQLCTPTTTWEQVAQLVGVFFVAKRADQGVEVAARGKFFEPDLHVEQVQPGVFQLLREQVAHVARLGVAGRVDADRTVGIQTHPGGLGQHAGGHGLGFGHQLSCRSRASIRR